jgi:uroporphyrinogen-III decarboxylase
MHMTGYERCLTVIQGGTPDRVPAYTPTIASDVASVILGRTAHTGGPELWYAEAIAWSNGPAAWQEFDQQVTEDAIALCKALDQDIIRFPWRKNIRPSARLDETTFLCGDPDGEHQIWHWDAEVRNFLSSTKPASPDLEDWPRLARKAQETVESRIQQARETIGVAEQRLQQRLGQSMMVVAGAATLNLGTDEARLMAAIMQPEALEDILDCDLAIGLAQLKALADHGVRVALGGGDMADKNGPLYSPEMFRRFMLPREKKIAETCRELGLHYAWRSDGNLWKVTDALFNEAGIPGFGEVDYDATMTVASLRARYPDLVLWANLSGDLLCRGTADDAYRHAWEALEASGGRGYFHGCSNTILPGTPVRNVEAMMKARDDFSRQLAAS